MWHNVGKNDDNNDDVYNYKRVTVVGEMFINSENESEQQIQAGFLPWYTDDIATAQTIVEKPLLKIRCLLADSGNGW